MNPDKVLCYVFLLAFLTLTLHKPQQILKCFGQLTTETFLLSLIYTYDASISISTCKHKHKKPTCKPVRRKYERVVLALVFMLASSRFTRTTQRRKHKHNRTRVVSGIPPRRPPS